MKQLILAVAILAAAQSISNAQSILDNLNVRSAGPIAADVTITGDASGTFGTSHANMPWTVNLTAANQNLDGDGLFDDTFTFDLVASTTSANGVSIWGQGANNSNGAGDDTSFIDLDVLTFSVSNVVGTTTNGQTVVFDGFTAAGLASFDFSGNEAANRSALINGIQVDANFIGNGIGGTVEQALGAPAATVVFENATPTSGAEAGTRIARTLDLQFSAVPEPSSIAIVGLLGSLIAVRRRK